MKKILLCLVALGGILMADFIRNHAVSIVTDKATGLMWQDNADVTAETTTWQNAIGRCEALRLGGYSDWRLPRQYELRSLADIERAAHGIDPIFHYDGSGGYWSLTTDPIHPNSAWLALYTCGGGYWYNKISRGYVRCVRNKDT